MKGASSDFVFSNRTSRSCSMVARRRKGEDALSAEDRRHGAPADRGEKVDLPAREGEARDVTGEHEVLHLADPGGIASQPHDFGVPALVRREGSLRSAGRSGSLLPGGARRSQRTQHQRERDDHVANTHSRLPGGHSD